MGDDAANLPSARAPDYLQTVAVASRARKGLWVAALLAGSACHVHVPIATPGAPSPEPAPEPPLPTGEAPTPRLVTGKPDTAPPELELELLGARPEGAVVRPTLLSTEGSTTAGSAFACRLDDASPPLLCTAHHLFGPAGGLSRVYAWNELDALVDRVEGTGFLESAIFLNAARPLPIEGAAPLEPGVFHHDLAVLRIEPPGRLHVLTLASALPAPGSEVFLIAKLESGRDTDELRHPAEVLDATDEVLAYKFRDPTIDLRATSGAPIVDASGNAVGVHLAGAYDDVQGLLGVAVPSTTVRKKIDAALHHAGPQGDPTSPDAPPEAREDRD